MNDKWGRRLFVAGRLSCLGEGYHGYNLYFFRSDRTHHADIP
jgi:hypothetical protein